MADFDGMLAQAAGITPAPVQTSVLDMDLSQFMPAVVTAPAPLNVPDQRKLEVAAAAEDKRVALGGSPTQAAFRNAAIARATGSGAATASGIEKDLATLSFDQLQQKYGDQAYALFLGLQAAQGTLNRQSSIPRSGGEVAYDTATGVGVGLGSSVLGIAALGAGVVNDKAGLAAADLLKKGTDWVQGTQSSGLQARRVVNEEISKLNQRDNTTQFEKDVETDGSFVAGLKRIGRDAVDSVVTAVKDPTVLSDGVAQGVGSVLAAGPVTKVLTKVGRAALGAKISKEAGTALSIGAMEAGGTYQDTVNSLQDMTHEQLLEKSPSYKRMVDAGWSPEDARTNVINRSALLGAAATAPLAVAAGHLVSKFEGAPFKVGSLREAAGNLAREGVEEGLQGATGQLSQNLAVQNNADTTRTLSEGVGDQIGQGALYGFGAAGALQAPGSAGRAALAGARGAASAIGSAVSSRVADLRQANEAASPVSEANLQQKTAEAAAQAPVAKKTLSQVVEASDASPEVKTQTNAAVDRLLQAGEFPTEWLTEPSLPESIRTNLQGSRTTVDAMRAMARMVLDQKASSQEDRLVAAQILTGMGNQFQEAANGNLSMFQDLPQDHPARQLVDSYTKLWSSIEQSPGISRALEAAAQTFRQAAQEDKLPEITPEVLDSPEGQQKADIVTTAAMVAPETAKLDTLNMILEHASQGKLKMSVPQFQSLQAVKSILDASQKALDAQQELGHNTPLNSISAEVMVGQPSAGARGSATEYATNVFRAMQVGNQTEAQAQLRNLQMLAQNQINKLDAINAGYAGGDRKYEATSLRKDGSTFTSYAPVIHPTQAKSVELAQRVALEAQRLVDVFNGMAKAFPELGGKELSAPSLVQDLMGRPSKVAEKFTAQKTPAQTQAKPEVKTTPQAETKVEPKPQPKPETPAPSLTVKAEVRETKPVVDASRKAKPVVSRETPVRETQAKVEDKPAAPLAEEPPAARQASSDTGAAAQEQAPVESKVQEKQGTAAAFPNLVDGNRFTDAHKLPEEPRTRLIGQDAPLKDLYDAFKSSTSLTEFTDGVVGPDIPGPVLAEARSWLNQGVSVLKGLNDRLQAFLTKETTNSKTKARQSNLDRLLSGENTFGWVNGKPLNLVEKTETGYAYNQSLVQTAVMAGLQWRLNLTDTVQSLNEEDISDILGVSESEVPGPIMDQMRGGFTTEGLKRSLAAKIQEYWGLSENRDAPMGYTVGIAEAMAAELLEQFLVESSQLGLTKTNVDLSGEDLRIKEINVFRPTQEIDANSLLQKVKPLIDKAVLTTPEPVYYFGDNRPQVPETQHRNPAIKLSAEQKAAIQNANNTRYSFDMPMLSLMENLGQRAWLELFGAGNLEGKVLNAEHEKSLVGQNRTISQAFSALFGLKSQAELEGVPLDQVSIHYAHNINRTGRLQNLAPFNPQSSKDIREAVVSTWGTLDLSNQSGQDYQRFMISLAQALGISVHKQAWETSIAEVEGRLRGKLAPIVEQLDNFLADGKLHGDLVQIIKSTGVNLSRAGLRALLEYARYSSMDAAERKSFRTGLYVEADGITNGPINAMRMLAIGQVTPNWIEKMAKGGLFFRGPTTTNEQYSKFDSNDLYTTATNLLKGGVEAVKTFLTNDKLKEQNNRLKDILQEFLPNASQKNGELTFDRGVAKNPLTITIYGSGIRGLTGKVADNILENIYERMSQAAQKQAADPSLTPAEAMFGEEGVDKKATEEKFSRFLSALDALTTQVVRTNGKGDWFLSKGEPTSNVQWDFRSFKLDGSLRKNFEENLRKLFVGPLSTAVRATVGAPTMLSAVLIKNATQIQSIFQQAEFNRQVREAIEKRKESNPQINSEGLSRNELQRILSSVLKIYPPISGREQSFFPAGSQSTEVDNAAYSQSLTGGFKTAGQVYGPKNAGVAGIPYMVIGSGDGYMIQRLASAQDAPTNALYIYDGIHFDLSSFEANSVKANRAVYDSWQGNPLRDVSEAYTRSLPSFELDSLTDKEAISVTKALGLPADATNQEIAAELDTLKSRLEASAMSVEALNRAMVGVNHHIDQMASAQSPYEHKGEVLSGSSHEAIAAQLEKLRVNELAKVEKEHGKEPGFVNAVLSNLHPDLATKVQPEEGQGASKPHILTGASLSRVMDKLNLSTVAREMWNQIQVRDALAGYTVLRGTPAELLAYAREKGLMEPSLVQTGKQVNGAINVGEKVIYWVQGNEAVKAEALAHEIIHGATIQTVFGVLDGKISDPNLVKAVSNLQGLMDQFLAVDATKFDAATQQAYANARDAILKWQNDPSQSSSVRQTGALNEFMAWGLANQDLNKLLAGTKSNIIVELVKNALAALKTFLLGKPTKVGSDMLSQTFFNSSVLLYSQVPIAHEMREMALHMSTAYGTDQRLAELNDFFTQRVSDFITTDRASYTGLAQLADRRVRELQHDMGKVQANDLANRASSVGFVSTPQAETTFKAIVAALATQAAIDPNTMATAQALYTHVLKELKVESFLADPLTNDPNARAEALHKFDLVVGKDLIETDLQKRSSLLPVFLGLAMVDDGFRQVLSKLEVPKTPKKNGTSVDVRLQNAGNAVMDKLSSTLSDTNNAVTVTQAVDALTDRMQKVAQERRSIIERGIGVAGNLVDQTNAKMLQGVDALVQGTLQVADKIEASNPNSKTRKAVAAALRTTTALVNEERAEVVAQGVTAAMNAVDGWNPIKDLVSDLLGRTKDNAQVYDLIKQTRTEAQQDRQRYREDVPTIIAKKFSRKLADSEWSSLYRGMAKTDLASLVTGRSRSEVLDLLRDPSRVQKEISRLESSLQQQDTQHWAAVQRKAKQLATFMNTGVYGTNLLRNAFAVARLFGENPNRKRLAPTQGYINSLDQLITLYAMQGLGQTDLETLASLVQSEKTGTDFVLAYLSGQRAEEVEKASWGQAKVNHYKGHIPSLQENGLSLVVSSDRYGPDLAERSYVRVGDYTGSAAEGPKGSEGYYFAPVSSKAPFNQGIFQNVRQTASGVEPHTGFSTNMTAGRITDPATVEAISKRLSREGRGTTENLLPVYDDFGKVVAYERGINPAQLTRLNQDTHLARMIGVWRGRQVEEAKAFFFNRRLIDALQRSYREDVRFNPSNQSQYINLMGPETSKDPVVADAVALLSKDSWAYARHVFGAEELWVRKDMLKDVIGERKATVGDAWTGNTRWSPAMQKNVRNLALSFMGNDAYRYLMNAEGEIQNLVKAARQLIVVKSVVVPAANFISNIYHMVSRGVPIATITRLMPKKLAEVHEYTRSRVLEVELEAELRAAEGNETTKLQARIKSLQDSYRRMSIWPLIEAGEFSSISDAGISRDELLMTGSKLHAFIERKASLLPEAVQKMGKYAFVTKDTALFQGLQLAVQYGDFLAKAVMYDDLTQRKKQTPAQALGQLTEEFVNYEKLSGRFRGYVEDMGLLWFYNFKIRSTKVALSVIRNNPVHALIMGLLPTPPTGSIGTPLGDNLFTKGLKGSLPYSIGPGMGFHAPQLNPWANLIH